MSFIYLFIFSETALGKVYVKTIYINDRIYTQKSLKCSNEIMIMSKEYNILYCR